MMIRMPPPPALALILALGTLVPATATATVYSSDLQIRIGHINTSGGLDSALFGGAQDDSFGALVTTFDDESSNIHDGSFPFPSDMEALSSLSVFDGRDIGGDWYLDILDDYEPDEGDDLLSWSIFGTLVTGASFEYFGSPAFDVDTDPSTLTPYLTVSDSGQISDLNVRVEFGRASVPEPATLVLMALGAFGVGYLRLKST